MNLSQKKRQRMLEFLAQLREEHKDDDSTLTAKGTDNINCRVL